MILGYSYKKIGTPYLVVSSEINILITIIKFIGFYSLIKNILNTSYNLLTKSKFKTKQNKIINKFEQHPFIFSFILFDFKCRTDDCCDLCFLGQRCKCIRTCDR